jgi:hypothetical protein
MKRNRYFRGMMPNSQESQIYKIIVGNEGGVIPCRNSNKSIVKLHIGDEETHACLNSFEEISHSEANFDINGDSLNNSM